MLTVAEAAKKAGVDPSLIRRWCRQHRIPGAFQAGITRPEWLIPERGLGEAMKNIQVKQRNPKPFFDFDETCCDGRPEGQEPSSWAKRMDDITERAVAKEINGHFAAGRPVVVGHDGRMFLLWADGREEEINDGNWNRAGEIWKANPAYDPPWPSNPEEAENE